MDTHRGPEMSSSSAKEPQDECPSNEASSDDLSSAEKPSMRSRIWHKSGLNVALLKMMFKGALAPTISIALYQSTGFADTYSTLGYLVAIMSVLSFVIMPRAKFVQTMFFNIIGILIGCCVALLSIYCSVQARAHTTPQPSSGPKSSSGGPSPGATVAPYNSSASAVCAVWLFFNIYIANAMRASRPQLQFPVIMYSIFTNVASTYAPQFATMAQGIAFARRLLEAFLTGFAIAIGVSFFIFPLTSRSVVFQTVTGYIGALRRALAAQSTYLASLENKDAFGSSRTTDKTIDVAGNRPTSYTPTANQSPEAKQLKAVVAQLGGLHGKLTSDLSFAKREVAYGNLDACDISKLMKLLRLIMLPIIGMTSVADIFDRVADRRGWRKDEAGKGQERLGTSAETKDEEKQQWTQIMQSLHQPFEVLTEAMDQGLQHVLYTLHLEKRPRKQHAETSDRPSPDLESKGCAREPGDADFAKFLQAKIDRFYEQRKVTLNTWCSQNGISLEGNTNQADSSSNQTPDETKSAHQRQQRRLYLILYAQMEFLLWSTGRAVLDLVTFADSKAGAGFIERRRVIVPGVKRMRKWLAASLSAENASVDHAPDTSESRGMNIEIGDAYQKSKDPEHLPPTNAWQRFGNLVRLIPRFLGSQESAFGFRVACATLSIGIVAFLRDTQAFFVQQRLVWAMIMVAIGMTVTAGAGVFGFVGRIAGTTIAMCTSYLIWYIANGETAGIIVLLFVFTFLEFYFVLKYPRFIVIALISMVTQVMIVGYELQVDKVGVQVAESSGQPAYPLYQLAPYRLACVAGGMLVAFIWTFFPYPLTARSQLRKDLGLSLHILANFYVCVHTTVGARLNNSEGDPDDKTSLGRRLNKARARLFTKEMALLEGLRQHSAFTAWEPAFGGKFPRQKYDTIIQEVQK
ncbi:MAG: hypothetical protein Q9174_004462 [Haloplaca sp. 1 TL-2023]